MTVLPGYVDSTVQAFWVSYLAYPAEQKYLAGQDVWKHNCKIAIAVYMFTFNHIMTIFLYLLPSLTGKCREYSDKL
jgi:hypothetical protein